MGSHINDQIRLLDVSCEVKATPHSLRKRQHFYAVLDRLISETPSLQALLSSSSYVDTEQMSEDMA